MVFVPYSEMTNEEKDIQQEIWDSLLPKYCPADDLGLHPCDKGRPCDYCHYDWDLQSKYAHEMAEKLTRLPEGYEKYFNE